MLAVAVVALAGIGWFVVASPRIETATGVIVAVDSRSLTDVRGFTLRTTGGQSMVFTIGVLENPTGFPAGHLVEHMGNSSPVIVMYRVIGGRPTAFRIEDAPAPAAT